MLETVRTKYQSLTTKQQIWSAVVAFIVVFLILPNVFISGEAVNERVEEAPAVSATKQATPAIEQSKPAPALVPVEAEIPMPTENLFRVVRVVDGDTVKLDMHGNTETVRLIGLDTPETVHPTEPVECLGIEASHLANQLLAGKTVRFESDDSQATRDRFGRLLGYVFLPNGDNVAEMIIRSGYGYEYTYALPYKYQADFQFAEQYAQSHELGLWAEDACE